MTVRALAVAAFLLTVEPLHAQRTVAAAAGSRIRVRSQDGREWRVGRLIQSPPDTLILRQCDSCATQTYLLSSLADVQATLRNGGLLVDGAQGRIDRNGGRLGRRLAIRMECQEELQPWQ